MNSTVNIKYVQCTECTVYNTSRFCFGCCLNLVIKHLLVLKQFLVFSVLCFQMDLSPKKRGIRHELGSFFFLNYNFWPKQRFLNKMENGTWLNPDMVWRQLNGSSRMLRRKQRRKKTGNCSALYSVKNLSGIGCQST